MREIKFRAWDKKNNVMCSVESIEFNLAHKKISKVIVRDYSKQYKLSIEEVDLLQYTGLKDKNGKEIYEGDILRGDLSDGNTKVVFTSGAFKRVKKNTFAYLGRSAKYEEIIGNIHENKDLLK